MNEKIISAFQVKNGDVILMNIETLNNLLLSMNNSYRPNIMKCACGCGFFLVEIDAAKERRAMGHY